MSWYNLYFVNRDLGYFEREEGFDAVNDEVAVGIARRQAGPQSLELWCGGRLVQRFAPAPAFSFAEQPAPTDAPKTKTA